MCGRVCGRGLRDGLCFVLSTLALERTAPLTPSPLANVQIHDNVMTTQAAAKISSTSAWALSRVVNFNMITDKARGERVDGWGGVFLVGG